MGFNLGAFLKILEQIAPVVLGPAGVPPVLIPAVVHGIGIAEQATTHGPDKKALVLDAVTTAAAGVNAVTPGLLVDGYTDAVDRGIDTTIAVMNLIQRQRAAIAQPAG